MFTVIANPRARHQADHQRALAEGLKHLGVPYALSKSETHVNTPYVACWGWRLGKRLKDAGFKVLVMERGYLGDRFSNSSLAWNGLNGHADFPVYPKDDSRFKALGIDLQPWKTGGDYALILGQVPNDASLQGKNLVPWYNEIAIQVREKHGLPVYFRQHPDLKKRGVVQRIKEARKSKGTLTDNLAGAAFTLSFNSNSSVDSVLAGVPCVVGDKGSMAWDMCGHAIDEIVRPDRQDWVEDLAWKQWTMDEIRSGKAVKGLLDMI